MATSRREPHSDARTNRATRNMSPVLKLTEPAGQGLRRARSVPSSPDRKSSPSPASSSSNTGRPSSSFNARTTPSSIHGKTKPGSTTRGKADKSSGVTLWPPALAITHSSSSKDTDMNRAAKAPSTAQKSKLGPKPGAEKIAVSSSSKLRSQKAASGAQLAGGRAQAMSSARAPGAAAAKKKTGAATSAPSIQRTRSVPVRSVEAAKAEEQEVELLMELDDAESISTPSIEEHLQERLPDPVELEHVDAIAAYVTSHDDRDERCCHGQEEKDGQIMQLISEEGHEAKDIENLNGGESADAGNNSKEHGVNKSVHETELKEAADDHDTQVNQVVSDTGLKGDFNETDELKESVAEPESAVKEEAEADMEKVVPPKATLELAQGWGQDDGRSNEVKEEGRSKPMGDRKSKVMALIGRFETAMSGASGRE